MADDDDKYGRKDPPEPHEWVYIWRSLEKSDKGWIITGPIWAVVKNWKALAVIAGVLFMLNQPEFAALVKMTFGAIK
jgi:hypothetical protein